MKKFHKLQSKCSIIRTENIDTDQIIPARFLKTTERIGLGKYLFYDNSYFHGLIDEGKKVLVAGNNFGCGSSREHAVWTLMDFGFEAIISSSFGDIFYSNSLKNGLLPVALKSDELEKIFCLAEKNKGIQITIDLPNQTVSMDSVSFHFPMDEFRKTCLLKGVDELGYILSFEDKIEEYEKNHRGITG